MEEGFTLLFWVEGVAEMNRGGGGSYRNGLPGEAAGEGVAGMNRGWGGEGVTEMDCQGGDGEIQKSRIPRRTVSGGRPVKDLAEGYMP